MYNLGRIEDAKSYYENALQINANLTDIMSEKELTVFNNILNNNTKQ